MTAPLERYLRAKRNPVSAKGDYARGWQHGFEEGFQAGRDVGLQPGGLDSADPFRSMNIVASWLGDATVDGVQAIVLCGSALSRIRSVLRHCLDDSTEWGEAETA